MRHPHYETPRDRQREAFQDEVTAFLSQADAQRRRLDGRRVLLSS